MSNYSLVERVKMTEEEKKTIIHNGPVGGGAKQINISLFGDNSLECVKIICLTIVAIAIILS